MKKKRRYNKRYVPPGDFCEWQLSRYAFWIDSDLALVLVLRTPDIYPAGNDVVELNGYNRWRIIVGIRVIRVTRA